MANPGRALFAAFVACGVHACARAGTRSAPPRETLASAQDGGSAVGDRSSEAATDAGASAAHTALERALFQALVGNQGERFWIPSNDGFTSVLEEDVLLDADGGFVTHIHEHPGFMGKWRIDGDALTFTFDEGAEPLVITSVRVTEGKLYGKVAGHPVVLRQFGP